MRTLALLAALLLLALQAQAQTLPENVEEDALQEQPGEGVTMAVSFTGPERSALQKAGPLTCRCHHCCCQPGEKVSGYCEIGGKTYVFCCR
ncbi:defensin alpha 5-like [Dipodomys merriami]|uniref:defensin alpha 5-like n=1 Tax=Dipodomys merriami TaxID=94247 RepID=UPI00384AEDDA